MAILALNFYISTLLYDNQISYFIMNSNLTIKLLSLFILIEDEEEFASFVQESTITPCYTRHPPFYRHVSPSLQSMYECLGGCCQFHKAFRMDIHSVYRLYTLIQDNLFLNLYSKTDPQLGGRYPTISPTIRVIAAIRFVAGASVYDLCLSLGISIPSIYISVWAVVDAINKSTNFQISFPSYSQQSRIAAEFCEVSGTNFGNCIGCLDGILIWTKKPAKKWCRRTGCGEKTFFCQRKNKFGLNMQAICDKNLNFSWVDIRFPGSVSDYLSWIASGFPKQIEDLNLVCPGFAIYGDNAYVSRSYMAVPFKGTGLSPSKDAYNFYHSQLRTTIERAFGVLVFRWAILRSPINVPLNKVARLVLALCKLHNFCISEKDKFLDSIDFTDSHNVISWDLCMGMIRPGEIDEDPLDLGDERDDSYLPRTNMLQWIIMKGSTRPVIH